MSKTKTRTKHQRQRAGSRGAFAVRRSVARGGHPLEVTACWADAPCRNERQLTDAQGRARWVGWGRTIGGIARFCGTARVTVHDDSSDSEPHAELDLARPPPTGTNTPDGRAGAILPGADATLEVPPSDVPLDALDPVAGRCHDETLAHCEATVATGALSTCTAACRTTLLPECAKRRARGANRSRSPTRPAAMLCGSVGEKCVARDADRSRAPRRVCLSVHTAPSKRRCR